MTASDSRKATLVSLWQAAIEAVSGYQAVANALRSDKAFSPSQIVAVGKAASGMCLGALDNLPPCYALVVTKYGHVDEALREREHVTVLESAHPTPDRNSLAAGRALLELTFTMPGDSRLLLLVSGGASALAEALPGGMTLQDLQTKTDEMIANGSTIAEINAWRKQNSLIKGGKLIEAFKGEEVRVYAISDVEGDAIETIGSGLGDCHRARVPASSRIIASNRLARERVAQRARELGLEVRLNEESLYGDVFDLAGVIGETLRVAEPGIYLWGGEPTVRLPDNPGEGGRNQSLALAVSEHLAGRADISLLVAGTDGTDGPTDAAGGIVDGDTWRRPAQARKALQKADAGSYLRKQDALFVTGPTNTNVMDLAIALIEPPASGD
jgi:hydroxypyruvate reductase